MSRFIALMSMIIFNQQLYSQMIVAGADSLKQHYQNKASKYLDKDQSVSAHYTIDLYGISVYAGEKEKTQNKPEYKVTWQELNIYKNMMHSLSRNEAMAVMQHKGSGPFSPEIQKTYYISPAAGNESNPQQGLELNGLRIALDPGHFGYDSLTILMEEKYLDFSLPSPGNDSLKIKLHESYLTYVTAGSLEEMLRKAGATVFNTRPRYGVTSLGKTYQEWKRDDYARCLDSLLRLKPDDVNLKNLKSGKIKDDKSIFRYVFREIELKNRAELIEAFKPDLTVIMHYNVDDRNKNWKKPSPNNFNLAFVAGSFMKGELDSPEARFDFLRILILDDLEQSISASAYVTRSFSNDLHVPLAKTSDADYLSMYSVYTGKEGVYCRNLGLLRLLSGTVIYGETLFQDNIMECQRLNMYNKDYISKGTAPARTEDVAMAYFNGIKTWALMLIHD
ncbi:MAG: hypothetical protein Fur0041_07650 [Bacteroidia bacterium]